MNIKQAIKEICSRPDGVDLVGFSSVERFRDLPLEKRPETILPAVKTIIVLGSQIFKSVSKKLTVERRIGEVSFRDIYDAHIETVDADLRQTSYRIARFLTNNGYNSINLGQDLTDNRTITALFSFKYAAAAAGLGTIGKNGLLLTPDYGARVRLSVVLSEALIEEDPILEEDLCIDCSICIATCPSGALKEPAGQQRVNIDRFVCSSFYTANRGCGLCMSRCPK